VILEDIARHAALRGEKPCLVHWEHGSAEVLTFSDLALMSDRLAGAVRRLARPGSSGVVLIVLKHHVLQLPLFVGCMKAGFIPCFLPFPSAKQDPALYWKTHAEVVTRSAPALVVTYAALLDGLQAIARASGAPVADVLALDGDATAFPLPDPDGIALLQHSSGTTGLKKGVALTYVQIARQAASYAVATGLGSDSIVVSWLPYYHDMGLFTAFLIPLTIGATIVSMDAFEWVLQPCSILDLVARFHGTHCWLPNFAFAHIVSTTPDDRSFDLSSLEALVSCAEPVRAGTLAAFLDRFAGSGLEAATLKACYAMAETCFAMSQTARGRGHDVTWYDAALIARHGRAVRRGEGDPGALPYVSNGRPIAGIEVRILPSPSASQGDPSQGVPVGEIAVRGSFVFDSYFANPRATAEAFDGDWYKTGDIGFIDDGEIYISGRLKDLLIVHGRNYHAHDIEAAVGAVDGIVPGRVVALGVASEVSGSEEAIILAETDAPVALHGDLRRAVKRRVHGALDLTPHKVAFVPRGALVKTTSGKISRSENLARFRSGGFDASTEDKNA
jgi:acyl-CoA synthetase (AMP-forming)/AMP-acid ligase II